MDIGRTNKRVTFCRYTEKQNELLQTEKVLEEIKTVWASVEPTRGREYQEAQRIRPELTYKITTRYHKEVTPDMFIKFKDRYFQIVSIINVRERNEMLEIVCTEKLTENPAIENKGEKHLTTAGYASIISRSVKVDKWKPKPRQPFSIDNDSHLRWNRGL